MIPSGLGIDYAVILVHDGMGTAQATAAVLLYRLLSFGFGLAGRTAWFGHEHAVRHASAVRPAVYSSINRTTYRRTMAQDRDDRSPRPEPINLADALTELQNLVFEGRASPIYCIDSLPSPRWFPGPIAGSPWRDNEIACVAGGDEIFASLAEAIAFVENSEYLTDAETTAVLDTTPNC